MINQFAISLPAHPRGFHLITDYIKQAIKTMPEQGLVHVFIKHTSAGLTINEDADPSVRVDYETIFNTLVPEDDPSYTHTVEGSDDMPAHVKSSLVGSSVTFPITNHSFNFGTWQGIYLCEFRNHGGSRKLVITVYS